MLAMLGPPPKTLFDPIYYSVLRWSGLSDPDARALLEGKNPIIYKGTDVHSFPKDVFPTNEAK